MKKIKNNLGFTLISLLLLSKRSCKQSLRPNSLKGFTLIELLVVVAVTGILAVAMTDILTQTLRGQNKVKLINQIKQNGQAVLDKLSTEIRQSENVICVGKNTANTTVGGNDTLVIVKQGVYTRFRFFPPTGDNGKITTESWDYDFYGLVDNNPDAHSDEACSSSLSPNPSGLQNLTDVSLGISVDYASASPIFSWNKKSGYNDTITVKFKVKEGVGAGSSYEATVKEEGVIFATTVQIKGGK